MSHLEEGVLHALLDGEIPSTELPPIQAHLAGCAECRASLDEARALRGEVEALVEVIQVSEAMAGAAASRKRPTQGPAWGRRLAWAASLLLATGLGYAVRPLGRGFERDAVLPQAPPALASEQSIPAAASEPTAARPSTTKESTSRRASANRAVPRENKVLAQAGKKSSPLRVDSQVAASAPSGRVAANAAATAPVPAPAPAVATTATGGVPVTPPATPRAPAGDVATRFSQSMKQSLRLEELVVTSAQEARDIAKPVIPVTVIQFPEAVRRLGGRLRLVEGLVPLRIEAQGSVVRVIYPADRGELILAQWLSDGRLIWTLSGPPGFPADSLDRLRVRVRE
jgi:hypothetical protein